MHRESQDKGQQKPLGQGEFEERHHQNYEAGKKAAISSSESKDDTITSLNMLKITIEGLCPNSEITPPLPPKLIAPPLPPKKRALSSTFDEKSEVRSDVPRPVPLPRRKSNGRANSTKCSNENINNDSEDAMLQTKQQVDFREFVQSKRTISDDHETDPFPELPPRPIFLRPSGIDIAHAEMESLLAQEDDPPSLPAKKGKQSCRTFCKNEQARKEDKRPYIGGDSPTPPPLPPKNEFCSGLAYSVVNVSDWRKMEQKWFGYTEVKDKETSLKEDCIFTDDNYEEVENDKAKKGTRLTSSERNNELLRQNEFAQNVDLEDSDDESHYEETESWLQTPPKVEISSREEKQKEEKKRRPLDTTSGFSSGENSNEPLKCCEKTSYAEKKDVLESLSRKLFIRRKEQKEEEKTIPSARHFRNIGASKCFGKAGHKGARPIGWISSRNEEDFMDINDISHFLKIQRKLNSALSEVDDLKKRITQKEDLTKEETRSLLNGNRPDGTTSNPGTRNDMKPKNGETGATIDSPLTMSFKTLKQKTQNEPGIKDNFALKMVGEGEAQTLPSPIDNVFGKEASIQEEIETGKLASNDDNEYLEYFERSYVNQEILIKSESSYQVKTGDDEQAQRKTYEDEEDIRTPYFNIVCVDSGSRYLHLGHFNDSDEDQDAL